ncbi:hypothetical protein BBP40_011725 [Aspergillus hancockii]|nr:hypothetical protein BBP40_011725 [Aspergillus hancockii]
MESRIERMESILAASGLASEATTPATTGTSTDLDDQLSLLFIHDEGSSTFIGSSSGLSLLSPAGLQWISNRTGSSALSDLIQRRVQSCPPLSEAVRLWRDQDSKIQTPLPPKSIADHFVAYYFNIFNNIIPLFRRDKFEKLYEQQHSSRPPKSISWYASLNVILALGCLLSHEDDTTATTESSKMASNNAVDYLRNSWCVFTELSLHCRDIMTVQALLAMSLAMEVLLDKEATYIALGAAARIATSLGLQQQLKNPRLSPQEISERYIVFWCLYSLDKSLSLRLGRPPAIDDRDIEIDIPDEQQLAITNPRSAIVLLGQMRLSRIASETYSELYSARSRRYPALKRFRTISELDTKLEEWRQSLPGDIQPGRPIVCSKENILVVITLHLEYFNCLTTLHRSWAFQDQMTEYEELRNDLARNGCADIGDRVYSGHLICLDSARNTARLLIEMSQHGFQSKTMLIGLILYHSLSAFLILFANILQNPGDSYVPKDVQLLGIIVESICPALQASGTFVPNLASEVFEQLRLLTVQYVDKVHAEMKDVPKRPRRDSDEAVMRHSYESVADNYGQPREKNTNDPYGINATHDASSNLTGLTGLSEKDQSYDLPSGDSTYESSHDNINDLPANEMPYEQNPSNENYNIGPFAEPFPGSIPFMPWTLDLDLADLWQYGQQGFSETSPGAEGFI